MVTDSGDSKTRCSCILRCFELPYVALNVLPCSFLEFFRGPVSILPILEKHVAKHGVVVDAVVVVAAVAVAGCVGAAVVLRRLLSLRWALPEQGEASRLISGRKLPGCHGGGWPRFHLCEIENQISVPILASAFRPPLSLHKMPNCGNWIERPARRNHFSNFNRCTRGRRPAVRHVHAARAYV